MFVGSSTTQCFSQDDKYSTRCDPGWTGIRIFDCVVTCPTMTKEHTTCIVSIALSNTSVATVDVELSVQGM